MMHYVWLLGDHQVVLWFQEYVSHVLRRCMLVPEQQLVGCRATPCKARYSSRWRHATGASRGNGTSNLPIGEQINLGVKTYVAF